MRAARLWGTEDVRVGEEATPIPADGESLVQVRAVGLCGSDLHWFTDGGIGDATIEDPLVPGHEVSGIALDGPYAGRVVAIDPAIPCEECERCREGNPNLCPHVRFSGHGSVTAACVRSWRGPPTVSSRSPRGPRPTRGPS
ncbi:alcohol dehydrogenase catalytic domain-containing protein [Propioniciclava flava]